MKPQWILFEILINIIQGILFIWFIRRKLHLVKKNLSYAVIAVLLIAMFFSIYLFIDVPFPDTLVFLIPLAYAFYVSDDRWILKLFWNLLLAAVSIGTVEMMVSVHLSLFSSSWENLMSETPLRMIFVISTNIILLIVLFLLSRKPGRSSHVPLGATAIFSAVELLNLLIVEGLFSIRINLHANSRIISLVSIAILLSSSLAMILFEYMSHVAEENQNYSEQMKLFRLTETHLLEIKEMYTSFLAKQHDLVKQVEMVSNLSDSGEHRQIDILMEETAQEESVMIMTGCVMADALLTAKAATMSRLGITFDYTPYPLADLPIEEQVFCLILANLLDNAIEGVQRLQNTVDSKRKIHLSCARTWDIFFIRCSNPADPATIRKNQNTFISSKSDEPYIHGYGIENIRSMVLANDGRCTFSFEHNLFTVEIILPFHNENMEG